MKQSFAAYLSRHAATAYGIAVIAMMSIELFLFYGYVGVFTPFTIVYAGVETMLIFAPYWWLKGKWRMAVLAPVWFISIYIAANIWYLRFWGYPMPLALATQAGNANGVLIDSTLSVLSPIDIIFLLAPAAATTPWLIAPLRRTMTVQKIGRSLKLSCTVASFIMYVALIQVFAFHIHVTHSDTKPNLRDFIAKSINNYLYPPDKSIRYRQVILYDGFIRHLVFDINDCFNYNKRLFLSNADKESINRYLSNRLAFISDTSATDTDNLVFIIVESLDADAMHLTDAKGRRLTPVLDSLVVADGSISCLFVVPQVAGGKSSDGQMMYNLGTLPTHSGAAALSFIPTMKNPPALPRILPGHYRTEALFADDGACWGKVETYRNYGYDTIFNSTDYAIETTADGAMLDFAAKRLGDIPQPFMIQLLTVQMHVPYKTDGMEKMDFAGMGLTEKRQRYLTCTADFDRHLGRFLQGLREAGLADNTIVVIASDHNAPGTTKPDGSPADIVFIAANAGCTLHIDEPVHQVDVFPTILDLMGVQSAWRGVGHSILGPHRGESDPRQATVSDSILRSDYFPMQ